MRGDFLPFSKPCINADDIEAVTEVLKSGWLTTGQRSAEFEDKFSDYVGCRGSVALSSGTAGMHLGLKALGIGPGDEVITPSMTWVSTANLILMSGADIVFADVDRDTLMVTPERIERCITDRTSLLIPVHFAGAAADMGPIRELAEKYDIAILEDAAHALGTFYCGDHVGYEGTSIFSFHPIKNITTGEGGMFCSNDEQMLERIRRLKFHGLGSDAYDRRTQGRSPQAEVLEPGYKYNMTDISAALGINQLARVDDFNRKRTELAMRYRRGLEQVDEIIVLADPDYSFKHSWHLFVVRLDIDRAGISRDEFMEQLKQHNIGTGIHFRAVHQQKFFRENVDCRQSVLVNTEWNSQRICSLPLFPEMTFEDVDLIVDTIKEILA